MESYSQIRFTKFMLAAVVRVHRRYPHVHSEIDFPNSPRVLSVVLFKSNYVVCPASNNSNFSPVFRLPSHNFSKCVHMTHFVDVIKMCSLLQEKRAQFVEQNTGNQVVTSEYFVFVSDQKI